MAKGKKGKVGKSIMFEKRVTSSKGSGLRIDTTWVEKKEKRWVQKKIEK